MSRAPTASVCPAKSRARSSRPASARDRIDLLAVATGPGAFTGLRIGLAAIQGLAMTLNKPVIGVSALDALAEQSRAERSRRARPCILPWMDAQRGDVFATADRSASGATLEPPTAANPQRCSTRGARISPAAARSSSAMPPSRDAALIARSGDGRWETRTPAPLAPQIALIGRRRADNGEAGPPHALEPIYVRRPDAEIERERRSRA